MRASRSDCACCSLRGIYRYYFPPSFPEDTYLLYRLRDLEDDAEFHPLALLIPRQLLENGVFMTNHCWASLLGVLYTFALMFPMVMSRRVTMLPFSVL